MESIIRPCGYMDYNQYIFLFPECYYSKTMNVYEDNKNVGNSIRISEIRLIDKQLKEPSNRMFSVINKLIYQTIIFYTLPYEHRWKLEISGVYFKGGTNTTFFGRGVPNVNLFSDGKRLIPSMFSVQPGTETDIFKIGAKEVNPEVKYIKIEISSNGQSFSQLYETKFITKKFGFFSHPPNN